MSVRITLLGAAGAVAEHSPPIDVRDLHPPQARLLLAFLVTERHRPVQREEVTELLWADEVPATWDAALRGLIARVRAFLARHGTGAGSVIVTRRCYELHLPPDVRVDVEQGATDLRTAETAVDCGDPRTALVHADRAREVFALPFLPRLGGVWVQQRRDEHRERLARALELTSAARGMLGDHPDAIAAARQAWTLLPLRENALRAVINAHRAAADRPAALLAYHLGRERMRRELGVGLSASTERLFLEVLREDAEHGAPAGDADRTAAATPQDQMADLRAGLGNAGPAERVQLLLRLGTLLRLYGNVMEADGAFAEVAARARIGRDAVLLAAAAAGNAAYDRLSPHTGTGLALIEEALEALPVGHARRRAVLISRQVQYLAGALRMERAHHTIAAIDGLADDPDPALRSWALAARLHVAADPAQCAGRLADSHALTLAATSTGETELALFAIEQRAFALAELDDMDGAAVAIAEYAREAGRTQIAWARFAAVAHRGFVSAAQGRLGECEQIALEMLRAGQAVGPATTLDGVRTTMLYVPRWLAGRTGDLLPRVRALQDWLDLPETRAAVAFLAAESGETAAARAALDGIDPETVRTLEQGTSWGFAMFNLVSCCVRLGERDRCADLYRLLAPHADRNCVYSWLAFLGSYRFHLGRLAAACGDPELAIEHLEIALERHRAARAWPWVTLARAALAAALRTRSGPDDHGRAAGLEAEAAIEAQRFALRDPAVLLAGPGGPAEVAGTAKEPVHRPANGLAHR